MSDFSEDQARQRFMFLNLVRIGGVLLVLLGIAVVQQVVEWPKEVGYVLMVIGMFEVFFMPIFLAKRWRSGKE